MDWRPRPPSRADAAGVLELVNACTRADVDMAVLSAGDLGDEWATRRLELAVVEDPRGRVVGYLETEGDGLDLFFEGFVHPECRGRGIGSQLVEHAETIAVGRGAKTVTTNVGSETAVAFFEARGYRVIESEYAMFLDLEEVPGIDLPTGVTTRTFVEGSDEGEMYRAIRDSFGDDWPDSTADPEAWMSGHQSAPTYDPDLWLFAVADGAVVGAVMNRTHWHAQTDTGWVKNLGVVPAWRRRGVGRALLIESARLFRARGKRRMVLGVAADNPTGAPAFYRTVGLDVGGRSWDLRRAVS